MFFWSTEAEATFEAGAAEEEVEAAFPDEPTKEVSNQDTDWAFSIFSKI